RHQGARPAGCEPRPGGGPQARPPDRQRRDLRKRLPHRAAAGGDERAGRRRPAHPGRVARGGAAEMKRALLLAALLALVGCKKSSRPPALGEALAVEQPGGSVTQLIAQGTEIPTSATESFTTSRDDERRLAIHVLRGSGRTASK